MIKLSEDHYIVVDNKEMHTIPTSEAKEILGVVDVEKSMWYERNLQNPYPSDSPSNTGFKKGFELGYNQALEDNKERKYTEEDMMKAIEIAQTTSYVSTQLFSDQSSVKHNFSSEEIIQSLQPTEWEVEMVDGKLKLKP